MLRRVDLIRHLYREVFGYFDFRVSVGKWTPVVSHSGELTRPILRDEWSGSGCMLLIRKFLDLDCLRVDLEWCGVIMLLSAPRFDVALMPYSVLRLLLLIHQIESSSLNNVLD